VNQSRLSSFIEAWINVAIGFVINYFFNLVILNGIMGMSISLAQNLYIGLMFTVVSVARSYLVRRWFNARLHALSLRLAGVPEPAPVPAFPTLKRTRKPRKSMAERQALAEQGLVNNILKQQIEAARGEVTQ
jgi:hypothetical protein